MFAELVRFELRWQARQAAFVAACLIFPASAALLVGTEYGPANVFLDSPYTVTLSLALLSLLGVFVLSFTCAQAALRDPEHGMLEIVSATPVGKLRYLGSRFAGAFGAAAAIYVLAALALAAAPHLLALEPTRVGSLRPAAYAWALAVFVLPNLLLAGSLLFAVAISTRKALPTYVAGVFIYAAYMVTAMLVDSPLMAGTSPVSVEELRRAALLDPFGLSAFFEQTRGWLPAERNERLVSLTGLLLTNRLLTVGLAGLVLLVVAHRFSFRLLGRARRPALAAAAPLTGLASPGRPASVAPSRAGTFVPALVSTLKQDAAHLFANRSLLTLAVVWVFVVGMEIHAAVHGGEYGTRLYPTTALLLSNLEIPTTLLLLVAIVYCGAELIWRERSAGMADVVDTSPAPTGVFYLAKLGALAVLISSFFPVGSCIVVAQQMLGGHHGFELPRHLAFFALEAFPLLLFAALVLLIQVVCQNRYLGLTLSLVAAILLARPELTGLEHPLWRYGALPALHVSEFTRLGPAIAEASAWAVHWSFAAIVLALATTRLWLRGHSPLRARLANLRFGWGTSWGAVAATSAMLFAATNVLLFDRTSGPGGYRSSASLADWKAEYEKTYAAIRHLPQPSLVAVEAKVDLFPAEAAAEIAGTYRLENRGAEPVSTLWISLRRDLARGETRLEGRPAASIDERFGMHRFELEPALLPGGTRELTFLSRFAERGRGLQGEPSTIAENGTVFLHLHAFPMVGYRASYELQDPAERKRRGLQASRVAQSPTDHGPGAEPGAAARLSFATTVSTSADQIAVAPGELVRSWEDGGRRFFRYAMPRPMTSLFGYTSGRFVVARRQHQGVAIEVYHHPEHPMNVPRILDAATTSLDVFSAAFGPYPHSFLRFVEIPSGWGFAALALPGTVLFVEDRGFLTDARDPARLDLVARRVAHEVAHQWWGHQLAPAEGEGASTLVESLAKYSEQKVLRALHGDQAVRELLAYDHDRYFAGRAEASGEEPPCTRFGDQPHLYYGKGAVVTHALAKLLGEDSFDRALRRMLAEHADHGRPTMRDLAAMLAAEARPEALPRLEELLHGVAVEDFVVLGATSKPLPGGRHELSVEIGASRRTRQGDGEDVVAFAGDVEIEVFSAADPRKLVWSGSRRVASPSTTFRLDLPAAPSSLALDPDFLYLDRDRTDNQGVITTSPHHSPAESQP